MGLVRAPAQAFAAPTFRDGAMIEPSPERVQRWIELLRHGDRAARDALLAHAADRLGSLTQQMLADFPRLGRWVEADDVLQSALVRLLQALRSVTPPTVADFLRLATVQIRRELLDLARHYFGPEGEAAHRESALLVGPADTNPPPAYELPASTHNPQRLACWADFHRKVEALPPEERAVFELLWYQELSQAEVAAILGVSVPTVKRRWLAARLHLRDALSGAGPFL
jgi:RNA polymerase sigma-70 factor (ECF subfamily)